MPCRKLMGRATDSLTLTCFEQEPKPMMLITQHEAGCTLSPLRVRSDMCAGRLLFTSLNFFFTVWGMENRLSGHVSTAPGAAQSKLFF